MSRYSIRHRKEDGPWTEQPRPWPTRSQAVSVAANICNNGDADEAQIIDEQENVLTDEWHRRPGLARRFDRVRLVEGE